MRWENQNVTNLSQHSEIILLTEKVANLEKRLVALENRLKESSEDSNVIDLSQETHKLLDNANRNPAESEPVASKRGRRPLIPPARFERQRDDLINFIEPRWPDLLRHMRKPKSLESLLLALKKASPGAETTWQYLHLTENIGALVEFLESGRYKGEPRQIAYAMAGVPDMTWRSSLDACTKRPSRLLINAPAFKDHIRRHNGKLLRSLITDGPTEQNLRQLAKHCDECRRLGSNPQLIVKTLKEGKPLIE